MDASSLIMQQALSLMFAMFFVQAARNNVLLAVPTFVYAINNYLKFTMQVLADKIPKVLDFSNDLSSLIPAAKTIESSPNDFAGIDCARTLTATVVWNLTLVNHYITDIGLPDSTVEAPRMGEPQT
ncbi:CMP-sialic acid transporter 3 [Artemisia annua]|uniref:CMP-sialic acid transporter 3 n=1 Tax=Artemisia annua TaxID=35608 RepID=A0A2U1MXW8_ARTAN|nr:CMP-sialic acid transporter 3 [Artemisia annua]